MYISKASHIQITFFMSFIFAEALSEAERCNADDAGDFALGCGEAGGFGEFAAIFSWP